MHPPPTKLCLHTKLQLPRRFVVSEPLHGENSIISQSVTQDTRILERFHMKCQCQIPGIRRQNHVVSNQTGLPSYRIHSWTPQLHFWPCRQDAAQYSSSPYWLRRQPDKSWKHHPGRANKRWLDQIRDDNLCQSTRRRVEGSNQTRSFRSDATAQAD